MMLSDVDLPKDGTFSLRQDASQVRQINPTTSEDLTAPRMQQYRQKSRNGANANKLYHMEIVQCPRPTLADANKGRDYRVYEEFAKLLMHRARREYAGTDLAIDVDNTVYALHASTIDLTLSLFSWAKFRKTKGTIKLHAMIDHYFKSGYALYSIDHKM